MDPMPVPVTATPLDGEPREFDDPFGEIGIGEPPLDEMVAQPREDDLPEALDSQILGALISP